ncbi:unnamed protein product, partial [Prorocentrum cordatum]
MAFAGGGRGGAGSWGAAALGDGGQAPALWRGKGRAVGRGASGGGKGKGATDAAPRSPSQAAAPWQREIKWRCAWCSCARNLDSMVYCKHCGEWRTEAPSQGADAALEGPAVDPSLTVAELEDLVRLAEKAGDQRVAGRYKQQLQVQKAGDPPPQQRISAIGAKVAEIETVLEKEVQKLEQYQQWVAQQTDTVAELSERLSQADAEYRAAVASLVGDRPDRAASPAPPRISIKEVVDGTGSIVDLIDVDSVFDVDGYECSDDDRKNIADRRDLLRSQLQDVAKGLFSGALEKLEAIKAEQAAHVARLTKKKRKGASGEGAAAGPVAGAKQDSTTASQDPKAKDRDKSVGFADSAPPSAR